jgi:hypothetical protein
VPNNGTFSDVGKHALIGWDGSREAARAIRDAMLAPKQTRTSRSAPTTQFRQTYSMIIDRRLIFD